MRVLVYLNDLSLGGTVINALDLARVVRERHGIDSVLVGRQRYELASPSAIDLARAQGLEIHVMPGRPNTRGAAADLRRVADEFGVDLVHTYGTGLEPPAFWGPCRFGRLPLVMTVYEMETSDTLYPSAPLIVGTGYQVEELTGRRGPVSLVSPPVDLTQDDSDVVETVGFNAAHGLDPHALKVVVVSRLVAYRPIKTAGIESMMAAIEQVPELNVQFVVVGTGDEEERLRAMAIAQNQRSGRRSVVMVGSMMDPRPAYASADIVLGMGGSAARGLAFGKPLIVSGEFGWSGLFSPATAESIFRRSFWSEERASDPLDRLVATLRGLRDPQVRLELGRFGREFAEDRFGLSAMADRLSAIYHTTYRRRYGAQNWVHDLRVEPTRIRRNRQVARAS